MTAIPGVVSADARMERIWTGQLSADGVIGDVDGTVLLIEPKAHRVNRMTTDGSLTLWLEDTNEVGGIAIDPNGRYISVERDVPGVRVLYPERRVLADTFEGEPIGRLADIVADSKGGVYTTELPTSSVLYLIGRGHDGPGGGEADARSLYKIPMIAEGFKGRAK